SPLADPLRQVGCYTVLLHNDPSHIPDRRSRMPVIRVENVSKEFRTAKRQPGLLGGVRTLFTREYTVKRAVDSISFSVDAGELIGYIGPNGAGKSTTIKMLTGILTPTLGAVEVAGLVPYRRREQNALN